MRKRYIYNSADDISSTINFHVCMCAKFLSFTFNYIPVVPIILIRKRILVYLQFKEVLGISYNRIAIYDILYDID
jgi:hypothetical protein